jgi:membrane-anchored protein YejM (alkaline phosphatase superfamily)
MAFQTNVMVVTSSEGFLFIERSPRTWGRLASFHIKATQVYGFVACYHATTTEVLSPGSDDLVTLYVKTYLICF